MANNHKSRHWAACSRCSWFQTYLTRSDAADGQKAHDAEHGADYEAPKKAWQLSAQDREFLKINRILAEDSE